MNTDKTQEPITMNFWLNLIKKESAIVIILVGCLFALGNFTNETVERLFVIVENNTTALNRSTDVIEKMNGQITTELKEQRRLLEDILRKLDK